MSTWEILEKSEIKMTDEKLKERVDKVYRIVVEDVLEGKEEAIRDFEAGLFHLGYWFGINHGLTHDEAIDSAIEELTLTHEEAEQILKDDKDRQD